MKKLLLPCFLALLCLFGSETTALSRVVESPGTDILHRFEGPDRGGETRSDTLSKIDQRIDSNDQSAVLIYVELVKKGQLDTLTFETVPFLVSRLHPNYRQTQTFTVGRRGNFFEGINPLEDQLFLFRSEDYKMPGYISIKDGEESILDSYLVFPGDSVMVRINTVTNQVAFAGPDAALFSCQYQMAMAIEQERFGRPSQMTTESVEELLSRGDYRALYETAEAGFGGHMELVEYGQQEKELLLERWRIDTNDLAAWKVLESHRSKISPEAFAILEADLIGNYRAEILRRFREELYGMAVRKGNVEWVSELATLFLEEFILPDPEGISVLAKGLSRGWLDYQYELAYLKSLTTNTAFTKIVREEYDGDLRAKINLKFLVEKFPQIPNKKALIERIAPFMQTQDQLGQLEEYSSKYISGVPIRDFGFRDETGRLYSKPDFKDKVVVFYFWSTGCGASANFYRETVEQLIGRYQDSEAVQLVSVNGSRDVGLWKKGLVSGDYTSERVLNLYMGSEAEQWKQDYNIHLFPQLMMMDGNGRNLEILYLGQDAVTIQSQIDQAVQDSTLTTLNSQQP